jgi:TQXA domain-containing protein/LPXTG-motif cell wall-anchored protein
MRNRWQLTRVGAALACTAVAVTLGAMPAGAEAVTGKVAGDSVSGFSVNLTGDGFKDPLPTSLIGFQLDDGTQLQVYCVAISTNIDRSVGMVEVPWDQHPENTPFHQNSDKINWVLHNGYPVKPLDELATKLTGLHGGLSVKEAITATQAAAWHFSDNADLNVGNALHGGDADSAADVVALYKFLIGSDNVGLGKQPTPTLEISPKTATGEVGKLTGPFTVSTTGMITDLTTTLPAGVTLTDKDGKELAKGDIKNGSQVFVKVPAGTAAGQGGFDLKATAAVATGRLFVGKDGAKTQSLIVAKSETTKLSAGATASWKVAAVPTTTTTPAPQGSNGALANTGASIAVPGIVGLVLVAAGAGALLFLRRRRSA